MSHVEFTEALREMVHVSSQVSAQKETVKMSAALFVSFFKLTTQSLWEIFQLRNLQNLI